MRSSLVTSLRCYAFNHNMKEAKNKGLIIGALEDDNEFQDKVLSAFHAAIAIHLVSNSNIPK
ncbi:hypothetical protein FHEFKHOI_01613 [Candidatus Methanoperedenaceae archaeon GB50]|nr:hypothetical protein AIOGIFDO_01602 [Candidatus Methanoperedenaceae archaeon GB37]CAD7774633.1 hypothetical protein FHEFKHOI_01613 [Candidatus Methanoperedenaceae archaeon GB50]CAD7778257.1 MAG: hypothetical protein KBONHNOK_01112 [Candidatus Methanoperedenaceae archaeon GB50]